jgi:hypothetical protein
MEQEIERKISVQRMQQDKSATAFAQARMDVTKFGCGYLKVTENENGILEFRRLDPSTIIQQEK